MIDKCWTGGYEMENYLCENKKCRIRNKSKHDGCWRLFLDPYCFLLFSTDARTLFTTRFGIYFEIIVIPYEEKAHPHSGHRFSFNSSSESICSWLQSFNKAPKKKSFISPAPYPKKKKKELWQRKLTRCRCTSFLPLKKFQNKLEKFMGTLLP